MRFSSALFFASAASLALRALAASRAFLKVCFEGSLAGAFAGALETGGLGGVKGFLPAVGFTVVAGRGARGLAAAGFAPPPKGEKGARCGA